MGRAQAPLVAVVGMVVMYHLVWPAVRPLDPRMPLSFVLTAGQPQWIAFTTAVLAMACVFGAVLVSARREMAFFAVAAGAGGIALRGEPFRTLLQYDTLGVATLFSRLTMETWILTGVLVAAGLGIVLARRAMRWLRPGWAWRGPTRPPAPTKPSDLWQRGVICLFIAVVLAGMMLFLLQQSDDRGQVVFAVSVSFFLAMAAAHQVAPGPFTAVAILLPPIVATLMYALDGRTIFPPTPQGWATVKPYAMVLPLDWVSFGTAGAMLGYCASLRLSELRAAEAEENQTPPDIDTDTDTPPEEAQPPLAITHSDTGLASRDEQSPRTPTERTTTMRLGAQLYTLRDFCKTMPDIAQTLRKVRQIGYTAVQVSGVGPVDPKDLAKVLQDEGLAVAGTHMGWERFLNETDEVIATHKTWGTTHSAIGALPQDYYTPDGLKRFLDELALVAPKLQAEGLDFSFHNHSIEFIKFDGRLMLDLLYEQTDPAQLKAEIDTYWVQAGGGTPQEWVAKLPNRQPMLHLKDYAVVAGQWQPRFAPVGEGNLNWTAILAAARGANVEWALVEQDDCYGVDPFDALAISYRNLKAMGLE